jgi:signal transduction histidine kinase
MHLKHLVYAVTGRVVACGRDARTLSAWLERARLVWLAGFLLAAALPALATESVTLQLKWTHAFQFAGYYAAQEKGFYREAGLTVKIEEAKPGLDVVKTVLEGRADYGVGTSSLLLARQAGQPVVALAVVFQHSPLVLIARQSSKTGPYSVNDLLDKRVMIEPQSDELLAYLKRANVPLQRLTQVPHSYHPQDLLDGKVDAISAYVTNEPYFLMRAGLKYQTYSPRSVGIDFYGDNLFTSEQELQNHPARVAAFRAASLRGWQYAMAHPEEIADLILTRYSQQHPREFYLFEAHEMAPLLRTDLIEVGYMNPERWRHIASTYADLGLLPGEFPLDGFLYQPVHEPHLTRLYALTALLLVVSAIGLFTFRINRRLQRAQLENERANAALAKALLNVEQAESEQRQLLSMASHEFRTPAAMIKASLDSLAILKVSIPPEVTQRLDNIGKASQRLNKLANSLILHDRLQELALKPRKQTLELGQLMRDTVDTYRAGEALHVQLPAHPVRLNADAALLGIALHNLLDNALRFHGPQQTPISVGITPLNDSTGAWIELRVADQGPGVAEGEKENIFQRFYSTKSGEGHGLGLSIVLAVARAHGGTAYALDNSPHGAVLVIKLPVL